MLTGSPTGNTVIGPGPFPLGRDGMVKLDHIRIAVRDVRASRDWYVNHFGFKVEFEIARRKVAALEDDAQLTLLLEQEPDDVRTRDASSISRSRMWTRSIASFPPGESVSFIHRGNDSGVTGPSSRIPTGTGSAFGTKLRWTMRIRRVGADLDAVAPDPENS